MSVYETSDFRALAPSIASTIKGRKPFRQRNVTQWAQKTDKYWLAQPKPRDQKWARWIVLIGMGVGAVVMLGLVLLGYLRSNRASYVLVFHDTFESGDINASDWVREEEIGGYRDGSFDWTTASPANSFVRDRTLYLTPTLLPEYDNGTVVDLTASRACTADTPAQCIATQNVSAYSIVPPVATARLRTTRSITYGKVEIEARFPRGDWIFPTLSLEPDALTYGQFPASGDITIAQSRGNRAGFASGGRDAFDALVHFGADGQTYADAVAASRNTLTLGLTDFSRAFHTFGLEWTPHLIRIWVARPSNTVLDVSWPLGFWHKANYKRYGQDYHWARLTNPWTNGTQAAPYDMPFHLVLRCNVGAVSGVFADVPEKPWYDQAGRGASMIAFSANRSTWYDTWGDDEQRSLKIRSVKMWQQVGVPSRP